MHLIDIDQIIIPENRLRREFDQNAIIALANSIASKGLLHPPVLRNDGVTLLAGERRLRAIRYLYENKIPFTCEGAPVELDDLPYTLAGELDEIALREAELEENTIRRDLTWTEQTAAVAELHALRIAQKGAYDRSTREGWTVKDTASEILGIVAAGSQITAVQDSVLVAKHLSDPDVANAKSQREALKVISRKQEAQRFAQLAENFANTKSAHTVVNGDALAILPTLPDTSFDIILTDPPYGINAQGFGGQAAANHEYNDSPEYFSQLIEVLAKESYRVSKPQAHAYIFCDIRMFATIELSMHVAGWDVWPVPLIWNKGNGMLPRPEHGPRRTYEAILYALKGDRRVLSVQPDVINIPGLSNPRFGAEKPAELYASLLRRSARPGDTVLDCFAGAGPILPAANATKCIATAVELIDEKYHYALTRTEECITSSISPMDLIASALTSSAAPARE